MGTEQDAGGDGDDHAATQLCVGHTTMSEKEGMKNLELQDPLLGLIKFCETHCIADCCDIDAFDVSSSNMEGWIEGEGPNNANIVLRQIEDTISDIAGQKLNVYSDVFNYSWTPDEFEKYLRNWAVELKKAMASYERFHQAAHKVFKDNERLGISDQCAKVMVRLEKESLTAEELVDEDYIGLVISGQYKYQFLQEFMFHLKDLRLKGFIQPNSGKYELTEAGSSYLKEARKKGNYKSIIGK